MSPDATAADTAPTGRPAASRVLRLAVLLVALTLPACASDRTPSLLGEGRPLQDSFRADVSAERVLDLLVVPVDVGNRRQRFLLDSGAPAAVTPELAAELGLEVVSTTQGIDAHGTEREVDVVRLPEVRVGGVGFADIAALRLDLASVPELRCLDISGLLGANLMRQAAWQIDFATGRIRLTDRVERLSIPAGSHQARFITLDSGAPVVRPLIDGVPTPDTILDTGANSDVVAPAPVLEQIDAGRRGAPVEAVGSRGAAALGYGPLSGTAKFAVVDRLELGSLQIADYIVEFRDKTSLIGTAFLGHFVLTIHWPGRELWLSPRDEMRPRPPTGFGFSQIFRDGRLTVSMVLVGTRAWEAGVRPGDAIVAVGDRDLSRLSARGYCGILEDGLVPPGQDRARFAFADDDELRSVELERISRLVR